MRRSPGPFVPLEMKILGAAARLHGGGVPEFHGFLLAKEIDDLAESRSLAAFGTLYRTLDRMETAGLLASRREDPQVALKQRHLRRRLYRITPEGAGALGEYEGNRAGRPA